ncbi:Rhodanese- sulfurtransferase [Taxawa tesnikishii (nom. ined.)]|nr:Rhodanese- sulfurtransferase [Dothideales sp. JES 119]
MMAPETPRSSQQLNITPSSQIRGEMEHATSRLAAPATFDGVAMDETADLSRIDEDADMADGADTEEPEEQEDNEDAMDTTAANEPVTVTNKPGRLPITVNKPIPYTFDLGNMLCNDANPSLPLINQLLSACPMTRSEDSVTITLPPATTPLPREKPVPVEKPLTKWQEFAKKKGIKDKKREGKLVFDEASGEWVPKWGYKGKNKQGEDDWLVEVDEKKEREQGEHDKRKDTRQERKERAKRNERRMRANEKRAGKAK